MDKIDHLIDTLQAYKEGKTIEYFVFHGKDSYWDVIPNKEELLENIKADIPLRIKPEQKYRYYTNAEEFLNDSKIHGPYMRYMHDDGTEEIVLPTGFVNHNICFGDNHEFSVVTILNNMTWQDCTPCGILE